jgi:hypothetical protein
MRNGKEAKSVLKFEEREQIDMSMEEKKKIY